MAFVRRRGNSFQLIESYRSGGKVHKRVVANLGPHDTVAAARQAWPGLIARLEQQLAGLERQRAAAHAAAKDRAAKLRHRIVLERRNLEKLRKISQR